MNFPKLFEPITMRGVTFPNRIQRTSMVSGLATKDGQVTENLKSRYQREAKGGVERSWSRPQSLLPRRVLTTFGYRAMIMFQGLSTW